MSILFVHEQHFESNESQGAALQVGVLAGRVAYSLATPHETLWPVIVCADGEIPLVKADEARTAGDVSWDV